MKKIALAFALALASFGVAQAQSFVQVPDAATRPLRYVLGIGYTRGGDHLATAVYEDDLGYVNDKFKEERSGAPVKGAHVGVLVNAYF